MAAAITTVQTRTNPAISSGVVPYRLTVGQYLKMIQTNILPGAARVELLGGVLVRQMVKNPPHSFAIGRVHQLLRTLVPQGWIVRQEGPAVLGRHWRPEPDIAVAKGPDDLYRQRDPRAEELTLLVEVADSTYAADRGLKWRRYAAAGVPTYWIVNLSTRVIEVYSRPEGRGKSAAYRDVITYGPDAEVPVLIDSREVGRVAIRDILP